MGGMVRLKPRGVAANRRSNYTCSTLGCPDPALVVVPLNRTVFKSEEALQNDWAYDVTIQATIKSHPLFLRLCRRCVRTLATALPPGNRLEGAKLRYPEVAPDVCTADAIPNTPEYREAQRVRDSRQR